MAISVTTTYAFTSDDGTALSDNITETLDQDEDSTAPTRYQCGIGTTREQILDFSTAEDFGSANGAGANTMLIVNRDDSNAVQIYVSNTNGDEYTFILGVDEWYYLAVCRSNVDAAGAFDLAQIDAKSFNSTGMVELLIFNNPGS